MRKILSYAFLGDLSKDRAGTRPLTDKERRGLIYMVYSLMAMYLFEKWRANQFSELVAEQAVADRFEEFEAELGTISDRWEREHVLDADHVATCALCQEQRATTVVERPDDVVEGATAILHDQDEALPSETIIAHLLRAEGEHLAHAGRLKMQGSVHADDCSECSEHIRTHVQSCGSCQVTMLVVDEE